MNIKTARKRLGMSLSEFADIHGVTPLAVRRWEYPIDSKNHRTPRPSVVKLTQFHLDRLNPTGEK